MKYMTLGLLLGLAIGCTNAPSGDSLPDIAGGAQATATLESKPGESAIDAQELLQTTLAQAKKENKRVFVHLGAPWCGWCKVLEEFLGANATLLADDYIDLKIDIEQMKNGAEVAKKLRGNREDGGIPWIVILDGDGQELVTSDGPKGNIGCPIAADEQAYFISMLEKTRQHAPAERTTEIAKALSEFAQKKKPQ